MFRLETDTGTVSITDDVLMNLAGEAATACFGVKGMIACNKDGGPLQLLRRESMSKGIAIRNFDDGSISLQLHIGVDRGVPIGTIASSIINEVRYKLAKSTGIPLKSVDVFIDAIIA